MVVFHATLTQRHMIATFQILSVTNTAMLYVFKKKSAQDTGTLFLLKGDDDHKVTFYYKLHVSTQKQKINKSKI